MRSAYEAAVAALARRAHAVLDLRRALQRRRYAPAEIDDALVRLQGQGLLDDAQYAMALVRSLAENRSMGARRISAELIRRGVERQVASAAMAMVFAREFIDENALLERAATRKLRSLGSLPAAVQRRRLIAFLIRRGFPGVASAEAARRLIGG